MSDQLGIRGTTRVRAADSHGGAAALLGEYRMSVPTGALTVASAATATAGHIFAMRWSTSTGAKANIRFVGLSWVMTTAFGTPQNMAFDLIIARGYSASHTGGTTIDAGSTVANTGNVATRGTSLFAASSCKIATTGDLTAGTQTLDANSFNRQQAWMAAALGSTSSANFTLLDARDDGTGTYRSPITLAQNEGIVIRNGVLMGATGVGTAIVTVEWDEFTP